MRYSDPKNKSEELLRLALPHIARHGCGCQPPSYALWYEYVAGTNAPLKQALDARIAQQRVLTAEETEALYATHIAARDAQVLESLQEQVTRALDGVGQLTTSASTEAKDYGRSLQEYGNKLAPDLNLDALREIVGALAAKTQRMQQSNEQLAEKLDASQREFLDLKGQLASVQHEALVDPLTGLKNRRGFQRFVDQILASVPDGLVGASLLMADIDHFKAVNDTHGHVVGDKVLQIVAQLVRAGVKESDLPARFGGEEFAILLPGMPESDAMALAEQMRQAVARCRIRRTDRNEAIGSVTISFGVTAYRAGETLEDWISRADKALYQSKQRGRNCVTLADAMPVTA